MMKFTLLTVAILATVSLSKSADLECSLRKKSGMDMHWGNPENCGRFYRCSRGIKREIICPGEGEYSSITGKCVAAGEGTCGKNVGPVLTENNPVNLCANVANGAHIAKPGYCSEFLICYNGVGYDQVCDAGSQYDTNKAACVPDPTGKCWQNTCLVNPEGFAFAYPKNCGKYYVCTNKQPLAQNCDAGSAWNDNDSACTPDTSRACWVNYCIGEADGERIADSQNEHNYYLCENQVVSLQSCGERTFNPTIKDCEIDDKTTTTTTEIVTTVSTEEETTTAPCHEETTTECIEETTTRFVIATTKNDNYQESTTPSIAETTVCDTEETTHCAGGHKQGDFVGNPENCMNFFICDRGHMYEYSCGAGYYFDNEQQICELDTKGICPQCHTTLRKTRSVDSTKANCTCEGGFQEGDLVKHENDCNKFYICHDGELVEESCGFGNYYDSCNKVCQPDTDHTCWLDNYCANAIDGTILQNPKQCAGYIVCQNQTETYDSCKIGEHFNTEKNYCEPDADLKCFNPCENVRKIEFLPYQGNCSKFYFCNNGSAYLETCVTGFFDTERHLCLEEALCSTNICQGQAEGTTFPIANSTKSFNVCINNIPTVRDCPKDTEFNAFYGLCLTTASSNCDSNLCTNSTTYTAFSTVDKNGSSFCICKDQKAYEYQCPADHLFNEVLGICYSNSPCDEEICENAPEYFITINRNNTHAFCMCVDHKAVSVLCPSNGIFNPKLGPMGECVSNMPVSDVRCDETYCLSESNFTIFPAKNNDLSGFCFCNNSAASYKSCSQDSQFNVLLEICSPDCPVDNCLNQKTGYTFPVAHNARDFCYCVNSTTATKRTCLAEQYFNEATGICETPSCDVNLCLNTTRTNEPFAANGRPNSFCICEGNTPYLYDCKGDNIFNADLGVCVSPILLNCNISLCSDATENNSYPIPALNKTDAFCYCFGKGSVNLFYCPPGEQYNAELSICVAPQDTANTDCPTEYHEGDMIPDANNCRKYFIYSNGQFHEGDCGEGNYFDESCSYCKPDVNKQCTERTNCTCPGGYTEGQMLPNPSNCQLFYICSNGQLMEMDCGVTNYFDTDKAVCVPRTTVPERLAA